MALRDLLRHSLLNSTGDLEVLVSGANFLRSATYLGVGPARPVLSLIRHARRALLRPLTSAVPTQGAHGGLDYAFLFASCSLTHTYI
jgi:hypothetical protein